jgi:hypothetical protein
LARFQWASLQLEYMSTLSLDSDIRNRLGKLPPELAQIYSELYQRKFERMSEAERAITQNLFKWLLCATTLLHTPHIIRLIKLIVPGDHLDLSKSHLLKFCGNFVIDDKGVDTVSFAHLSVREFLEKREEYGKTTCHAFVAEVCIVWTMLLFRSPASDHSLRQQYGSKIIPDLPIQEPNQLSFAMPQYQKSEYQFGIEDQQTLTLGDSYKINLSANTYALVLWPYHAEQSGSARQQEPLCTTFCHFLLDIGHLASGNFSPIQQWTEELCTRFIADRVFGISKSLLDCAVWPYSPLILSSVFGFSEIILRATQRDSFGNSQRCNFNRKSYLRLALDYGQPAVGNILLDCLLWDCPPQDVLRFCRTYDIKVSNSSFAYIGCVEDGTAIESTLRYAPDLLVQAVTYSFRSAKDLKDSALEIHQDPAQFFDQWFQKDPEVILSSSFLEYIVETRTGHLVLPVLERYGRSLIVTNGMAKVVNFTELGPTRGKSLLMLPRAVSLEDIFLLGHKDPTTRNYYAQMIAFENDRSRDTLVFPAPLTTHEHEIIRTLASRLGLLLSPRSSDGQRQVRIGRRRLPRASTLRPVFFDSKLIERRGAPIPGLKIDKSSTSQWYSVQIARSADFLQPTIPQQSCSEPSNAQGAALFASDSSRGTFPDATLPQHSYSEPPIHEHTILASYSSPATFPNATLPQHPYSEPPVLQRTLLDSYSSPESHAIPVGEVHATQSMTVNVVADSQIERTTQSLTILGPSDLRSSGRNIQSLTTFGLRSESKKQWKPTMKDIRASLRTSVDVASHILSREKEILLSKQEFRSDVLRTNPKNPWSVEAGIADEQNSDIHFPPSNPFHRYDSGAVKISDPPNLLNPGHPPVEYYDENLA